MENSGIVDRGGFPYRTYPTGWYQVAWADEVGAREKRPLRYFGRGLVLYRGGGGAAHVMDAQCPHMGAHLGVGGCVSDDDVVCANHGWRFDATGRNVEVPYADKPARARVRAWDVREVAGMVLVWYHEHGSPPAWEPFDVPEIGSGECAAHPALRCTWAGARVLPQMVAENVVDGAHFKFVHGAAEVPDIASFAADGPTFRVVLKIVFGRRDRTAEPAEPRTLSTEAWGLGATVARFDTHPGLYVQTTTPVDGEHADSRATALVPLSDLAGGEPLPTVLRRFDHERQQFDRDLAIWENLAYVHPAPFAPIESKPFRALRRWATQFYPDAVPGRFGAPRGLRSGRERHGTGPTARSR